MSEVLYRRPITKFEDSFNGGGHIITLSGYFRTREGVMGTLIYTEDCIGQKPPSWWPYRQAPLSSKIGLAAAELRQAYHRNQTLRDAVARLHLMGIDSTFCWTSNCEADLNNYTLL